MAHSTQNTFHLCDQTLSPTDADLLLRRLALWRAEQLPPIGDDPQQGMAQAVWENDPSFAVSNASTPHLTLGIKHSGYGWLYFRFPADKANALARHIQIATGEASAQALVTGYPTSGPIQ